MADCAEHCDLVKTVTETESRSKSNLKRIYELSQSYAVLNSLATSVAVMAEKLNGFAEKQESLAKKIDGLDEKVGEVEKAPGKKWDGIKDKAIGALIAGLVGFLLFKLGLA